MHVKNKSGKNGPVKRARGIKHINKELNLIKVFLYVI